MITLVTPRTHDMNVLHIFIMELASEDQVCLKSHDTA